ncbi:MAG TPA: hypothetical protein VGK64_29825 [Bryobacteraceae bacterium]
MSFHRSANISPGPRPAYEEHVDYEPVTVAQVEQNLRNLFRRQVLRGASFPGLWDRELASRILRQHLEFDRFVENRIEVHADFGQDAFRKSWRHLVEVTSAA